MTPIDQHTSRRSVLIVLLALTLGGAAGCGRQESASPGAETQPAQSKKVAEAPSPDPDEAAPESELISVFVDSFEFGRDPFFPNSTRRGHSASGGVEEVDVGPLSDYLTLAGISPRRANPLALINQTTFAPGEVASVTVQVPVDRQRSELRKVNVHCLEIRDDSVLVRVEGEPGIKELRMPSAF